MDPILCVAQELPDHLHDLDQSWLRMRLGAGLGLGGGWQVGLELPFDLRAFDVTYTTLDGAPYDPPYDDIHHRDETLLGPADGELTLRRYGRRERLVAGAWLGLSLPLGRTEEDPFAAAEQGEWHQHTQLGAGLPLALLGASLVRGGEWGAVGRLVTKPRVGVLASVVDVGAALGEGDLVEEAVEGLAAGFNGALAPGFADGGAEGLGVDGVGGRERG